MLAVTMVAAASDASAQTQTTGPFSGSKVNGGTVTFSQRGPARTLTVSADFKVPDTPDPHWQVVDSRGQVYLLQKLSIKNDRINASIVLPSYVRDVARVQIYCSWAEALLGEASFRSPAGNTE
jgi:hypothetical protein